MIKCCTHLATTYTHVLQNCHRKCWPIQTPLTKYINLVQQNLTVTCLCYSLGGVQRFLFTLWQNQSRPFNRKVTLAKTANKLYLKI